ncbi:MAG: ROK family protein, partial [Clostridiales bacterium]|nr:ROK family protein [Clostridiales bacterium]
TLGTGVGGGVIIDNKLFEGHLSKGTEVGHTTLILDGEPCSCGRNGCVEAYVSATALIRQTKSEMMANKDSLMWDSVNGDIEAVNGLTAFENAKKGDASAEKVVSNYVKYLSEAMMNFFNIFRPEAFILGGGVSAQGDYLLNRVRKYCEDHDYGFKNSPKVELLIATLGNDAGIIGAASLV